MKLNNHGWGVRDMIIYSCLMIFFLFIVALSVSNFYDGVEKSKQLDNKPTNNSAGTTYEEDTTTPVVNYDYYHLQETKIKNAMIDYLYDEGYLLKDEIVKISLEKLISSGKITTIYDQDNKNVCTGYVIAYANSDGTKNVRPYISCSNYITEGY